ncbi:hypothetical protein [Streptomyces sp. BE133]|uniref:hypothetical protein n=1 Tax=Streptomyces sp. BE133 TaxID=3002523 RepID=UPI002E75B66D|nr:hypothetical protein [Streptomyces sp. BE133]MEE1805708.1 hypothetical protein [Streptomyces sp. BE133]
MVELHIDEGADDETKAWAAPTLPATTGNFAYNNERLSEPFDLDLDTSGLSPA